MPTVTAPPTPEPARFSPPAQAPAARPRGLSRRAEAVRRVVTAAVFFAALVYGWHVLVKNLSANGQLMLPPPESVWDYLTQAIKPSKLQPNHTSWQYFTAVFTTSDLFTALRVTMTRLMIGYIAGVLIGVPLGILTARFSWAEDTIGVMGLGLQTLPSVCWVPLALLWFGQNEKAMLFVVIMGTVWSVQI